MKGRKIADQVYLSLVMVEYAEELLNRAIVTLDQEKAYDKTSHRYLWEAMRDRKIPDKYINTVKAPYSEARDPSRHKRCPEQLLPNHKECGRATRYPASCST